MFSHKWLKHEKRPDVTYADEPNRMPPPRTAATPEEAKVVSMKASVQGSIIALNFTLY